MKNFLLIFFLSSTLLSSEQNVIEDKNPLKILTPSFKERKTLKLQLANNLKVYIVSDPQIDESSAALCIKAGSWNNPEKYPGMAHFLEHMLFMGTKAYPGEKEFTTYIKDNGGQDNAYTKSSKTVYGFSINNDAFLGALDRFSHFFIDPLIPEKSMKKELHAVDQEYAKNIEHDGWRAYHVDKETANPKHPHHGFGTGNSDTLGHIPRNEMFVWMEQNYSSENMFLFIYSPLPLDTLKETTEAYFSRVPQRILSQTKSELPLYNEEQKGKILFIEPVKQLQNIDIAWELPSSYLDDTTQSSQLLAYALSLGGKNSLLDLLKSQGLIEMISSYVDKDSGQAVVFHIDISLTDLGLQKYDQVIEQCFSAIKGLSFLTFPSYLYEERKKMSQIQYQYQNRSPSFGYAMENADSMAEESLATYPFLKTIPSHFDQQKVQSVFKNLTPQKARIALIADPNKIGKTLTKKEKWLGANYDIAAMPSTYFQTKTLDTVAFSEQNSLIPNDLVLKEKQKLTHPKLLEDSTLCKAYFYPDNHYLVPKVSFHFSIQSPFIEPTILSATMLDLFSYLAQDALQPLMTKASAAGLKASIYWEKLRLNLTVQGLSENASLFTQDILKITKKIPEKKSFENQKALLIKSYENTTKELPYMQANTFMKTLLVEDNPSYDKRLQALQNMTYDSYVAFHQLFLTNGYLEALYTGNLNEKEAKHIHRKVLSKLQLKPFIKRYQRKVLQFPQGMGPYMIEKNTASLGSSCLLAIEENKLTPYSKGVQQVLSQALGTDFFDSLRTKQKTGYIAHSWDNQIEDQLYQFFIVQSSSHDPVDLLYRFDLFLEDYAQTLVEKISKKRFEAIKKSIYDNLETPPINLYSKGYLLNRLAFEYADFNWIEKRKEALASLQYKDFIDQTSAFINRMNRKRLAVLFSGKRHKEEDYHYKPVSSLEIKKIVNYTAKNSLEEKEKHIK